ncbi:haly-1 [Pristionchus pacificus]|uniref:Histidine ammonia-lyase n=1 Tax=Pristionchus pacificus TaxID=54126 RepID=A0A2A6B6P9_PRIPA|nr:haly-1 [Pristionchus pacificus]|eukprot:PDM61547.1 haly-1 [Pristionchus pacificus]
MRLQIHVGVECISVACDEADSIGEVARRSIGKLLKLKPSVFDRFDMKEKQFNEIRRVIGNSLLDPDDACGDILKENEFIQLILHPQDDDQEPSEEERLAELREKIKRKEGKRITFEYEEPERRAGVGKKPTTILILDGESLQPSDLVKCEKGEVILQLSIEAEDHIRRGRELLERIASEHKTVYGITTGFGTFANVRIDKDQLEQLQLNLIRSHAAGYGQPLAPPRARMLLALRINILAKGHSGISVANIKKMISAFNAFCVSYVPQQGTVGCSGDLAPLAHLALGLLGEGRMWSPVTGNKENGGEMRERDRSFISQEGLALINGTQMVTALGALAIERATNIALQADVIAALSLDVLKGTSRAYDPDIHRIRPHKGQIETAGRLRALLHSEANPSQIAESHRNCNRVQDAYTLRCVPQVHGVVHDTIAFCRSIITTELNSATDNPLVFADREEIISGGNFHGEYPAKALDFLAIATHELAQMSERRLERLDLSGLPTFLTPDGGLNSGFMMIQVTAASLVSENKVLCHPSSADSIPTSCNQEDHVSMGGFAARKALTVIEHVEAVLAMELLAACQGLEFLKPLISTAPLNKVYELVRTVSAPLNRDRFMQPEIAEVWECVAPHLATLEEMEALDPDALRLETKTPTGIVMADRDLNTPDDTEHIRGCEDHTHPRY